ncbi:MAG: DNA recombination protein RmuC [Eubacteriales bacterium]|nr:DNA recombination protein RmuC [Eubacteriales bacterium]
MNMIEWIAINPDTTILLLLCAALVIVSCLQAASRRRFEKRMLREQKALQGRIAEEARSRQDSFGALAAMLSQSAQGNEERIRQASETMSRAAQETQRLNRDLRESALQQQIAMQNAIDERLRQLQASNEQRLEKINRTVDEQLQTALQKRLSESFRQVSDQLERVYKGLGEMQNLAGSVGDLRRVLQNVTVRGAWGEARLEALLTENLSESQFLRNTPVESGASERVEFAVLLPGTGEGRVLLPIDSKFPQADYERLTAAAQEADNAAIEAARTALGRALMTEAKRISSKYIRPPHTTDFAIMFLPTEGLFAEAMRMPGLAEQMQRTLRVIPAGPTTFTALLTSLQMGFRTLAVEQRSAEVWTLLGSVRKEFLLFGEAIEKTRRRLDQASSELDGALSRSRSINRRLADVENPDPAALPEGDKAE